MLFVGIEGGGTKTKIALIHNNDAPIFAEYEVSLKFTGGLFEESARRLEQLLANTVGAHEEAISISIGLAGAGRKEDQQAYRDAIAKVLPFQTIIVQVHSDAALTMDAALGETKPGIVLIAGTGSVAFVRDTLGKTHRVGGWGKLLGDEGSGHWIGMRFLQMVTHTLDGRAIAFDPLIDALFEQWPIVKVDPLKLSNLVDTQEIIPSDLAKLVFEYVDRSDLARMLIGEAAELLASLLLPALKFVQGIVPIEIIAVGSIAKQKEILEYLTQRFSEMPIHFTVMEDRTVVLKALQQAVEAVRSRPLAL